MTGNWALAEDVVSLTFLEAWRLRGKLRDEGDGPRPWLMGIAVNVLRNTTRAARRHNLAMARMPVADPVPDFADELVGRMADSEQLAAARKALGRLRRSEREVFALCVWSGLGYAEAAATLGIPVGTVRSRLSRARTRLRRLADDELRAAQKNAARNAATNAAKSAAKSAATNAAQKNTEPLPTPGQVQGGRGIAARPHKETHR
ncbi:RNA polymerase sigma factor [Kitasatospora purpeofusca]|uniref:RNA polymerase sigma factor n=1 Tax=Kitasatospora purpeofusca TaxID=67352 RepID=UPI0039B86AFD